MVNTINTYIERNKELLAKIEELENKEKTEISREAQLKIIDKIQTWKKENIKVGDRLKNWLEKYGGHLNEERNIEYVYPSHIMDNLSEERPLWKYLACNANSDLIMVQYLDKKENPLDELLEMMLDSILFNKSKLLKFEGLNQKASQETKKLKTEYKEKLVLLEQKLERLNIGYYEELAEKKEAEINKLKEELEENKVLIENLETELEECDGIIDSHEAALEKAQEWRLREVNNLDKKIGILEHAGNEILGKLHEEYDKNKDLYEQGKLLEEEFEKKMQIKKIEIEDLQKQVSLINELCLPLSKTPSKFKVFKEKSKTKLQNLVEKTKHRSQKLFAQIEVRVK